jgi:hypothetical protein
MLLDAIPLSEVTTIDLMKAIQQSDTKQGQVTRGYGVDIDFTHAFQIRTQEDGQNAGRKYIIRASSDEEVTATISELNNLAKKAAKHAAARTKWEKIQQRVRLWYNATWFQGISAFLIITVRMTFSH